MIQYIRDSYKNIKLLVGLFVALILFLLLVKYTFPKYQQKQNLKVLEYEGFILEKKKIPNVDHFYDTLVSQLEWRNYQFNSEINSEEIENLLKDASNISKVLKDMKFEAYVDLLSYFSFKRSHFVIFNGN